MMMSKQCTCIQHRYGSLSAALADINSGVTENAVPEDAAATVKVCTDSIGRKTVALLSDISVETQIDILRDIEIVLNGKTLALDTPDACLNFGAGTVCSINGNAVGSCITKNCNGTVVTMVVCGGKKLSVHGGSYLFAGSCSDYALIFKVDTGALELYDCVITGENNDNNNGASRIIYSQTTTEVTVYGCTVTAISNRKYYTIYARGKVVLDASSVTGRALVNEPNNATTCTVMVGDTGSADISKSNVVSCSNSAWVYGINNRGSVKLSGTTVSVESMASCSRGIANDGVMEIIASTITAFSQNANAIGIENANSLSADRIVVNSNTAGTGTTSDGIRNNGTLFIANSKVLADAPGDNANEENATGIRNDGITFISHTDVTGTLAGFSNSGKVFAEGGIFTGYSHGGFYFCHGADGIAYVNDAMLRCGHYEGVHTEVFGGDTVEPYGSFYVGGGKETRNSNITAYLDGCTIEGPSHYAFILRSTDGEMNNTVNMSNCTVLGNRVVRIDTTATRDDGTTYETNNHLNVGVGTNITVDMINNPDHTAFTNDRYRKSRAYFKAQMN